MRKLVKNDALVEDELIDVSGEETLPEGGPVMVSLEQWQTHREALLARGERLGLRLRSDQHPEAIAEDIGHFDVIALEFPKFRDGRAYSYARLLRERYGYSKELRAVGEVLLEQLHFMMRVGFDAFEIEDPDPLAAYRAAAADFTVWYQPSTDRRPTAMQLRHGGPGTAPRGR